MILERAQEEQETVTIYIKIILIRFGPTTSVRISHIPTRFHALCFYP